MSTSAILPVSSINFGSTTATTSQQAVLNNLLAQLQQAIGVGDLTTTQTLFNAINALSPSSAGSSTALGNFLTSLGSALNDNSATEAQSALATYQSATPAAASSSAASTSDISDTAAQIAAGLVQSQLQLSLVTTLLGPDSSFGNNSSSGSSENSGNNLINILNAAYPASSSSSSGSGTAASSTEATTSATPYDTLVSSIQASLAGGDGTLTPAMAYLQAAGNFVNTSA